MKSLTINKSITIATFLMVVSLFILSSTVKANPLGFLRKTSASATTTLAYMTPGTATTTAVIDCNLANASATGCDSGALLVALTASSSVSTLQVSQEFSQGVAGNSSIDCVATPTACDWYVGNQTTLPNYNATTTPSTFEIGVVPQFSYTFASTSVGGAAVLATNNLGTRLVMFNSPTRYTRFVFSMKQVANGNGAVYWEVISKKQNP